MDSNRDDYLEFTISYDKNDPVSITDFAQALEGVSELYSSHVNRLLIKSGEYRYYQGIEKELISQVYIHRIEPGSIKSFLLSHLSKFSDGTINGLGSWASIVSLLISLFKLLRKKNDSNETNYNINIHVDFDIKDIESIAKILQPIRSPKESIVLVDETSEDKITLTYKDKCQLDKVWEMIRANLYMRPLNNNCDINNVWVKIEKIKEDECYAYIIGNQIFKEVRLPVVIKNNYLRRKIDVLDSDKSLDRYIFLVDIHAEQNGKDADYFINDYHDNEEIDKIDRIFRS